MRTPDRWSVQPLDAVLALALTLAMQGEIWVPDLFGADSDLVQRRALAALSLVISAPIAFRRSAPWAVGLVTFAAEVGQAQLRTPPEGIANLLAMMVVAYSLSRHATAPWRPAGVVLVAAVALGVGEDAADHVFVLVVLGATWAAGAVVARRTEALRALELKRLDATRAGADEERLRIARELHDVVAHRVSMIVVQSQLADTLLESNPAGARRAVRAAEEAGRRALTELRSVLDLLHGDDAAVREPSGTNLDRLSDLVEEVRRSGHPVAMTVAGSPRPVSPAVSLAAFRIVQESLTNVIKHGGSAHTTVLLTYGARSVTVEVRDDGRANGAHENPAGHGLAGMRERAAFVGGTLDAGPSSTGGFVVRADLPTPDGSA